MAARLPTYAAADAGSGPAPSPDQQAQWDAIDAELEAIVALFEEGAQADARRRILAVVEQDDIPSDAHALAAMILAVDPDDLPAAVTHARTYVALVPDDERGWLMLGDVLADLEDWPDAEEAYRQALTLSPDLTEALIGMGEVRRWFDGACGEAERLFRQALAQEPDHPVALLALADLLDEELDRPDEAAALFQRLEAVEPGLLPPRDGAA